MNLTSTPTGPIGRVSNAEDWIGQHHPDDKLDLARVKETTALEATALHQILDDTRVAGLFRMRRDSSTAAGRAQSNFRKLSLVAILGTAVATLASGLLLYGTGKPPAAPRLVDRIAAYENTITWVQIIGLFATTVAASVLANQNFASRWAEGRRDAETRRREIFTKALELVTNSVPQPHPSPEPGNPVRQVLEFFRRYQLELQLAFYETAGTRHGSLATLLAWITAILAGVAAITGLLGGMDGDWKILSAFFGIAVPVLLSAAQSWRVTHLDTEKSGAYEQTKRNLENARMALSEVRKKADIGDVAAVSAFINEVHAIMEAEHAGWKPSGGMGGISGKK